VVRTVGVLALQGNYIQHKRMLDKLDINNILVQYPRELEKCDLLIIPGGESTAISKQIDRNKFRQPIMNFVKNNSVFGTCAGMILLSSTNELNNLKPLGVMDFKAERNAYGRQMNSFSGNLHLEIDNSANFKALFIRAPKVSNIGKGIKILATYKNHPVMITDGRHFATTFHPEIGNDIRIHKYIMEQINA
jgi:5'-phosphate synthase pdxT subunit